MLISITLYIILLAGALDFHLAKLIDFKLLLLLILGAVFLTAPFYEKGISRSELGYIFGRKAIEAGFIQTFLLLFVQMQNSEVSAGLMNDIAMSFRPLLYGFCMQILFSEKNEETQEETPEQVAKSNETKAPAGGGRLKAYGLTKRELEIAGLIAEGKSNGEIAERLYISETTVKKHVSNIFEKMGISRREELIRMVLDEMRE